MKLLKIEGKAAHFLIAGETFNSIDKITKEDLLRLANLTLTEESVAFDPYSDVELPNQAHQVIYKSVLGKLESLRERKAEFADKAARLYLDEYKEYKDELAKP
ncbi:hypothetical protein ED208_15360 [Stagnimonas aquatica]|uniref:Uncharacterized protein n=1 Tax=Stagnimonas aquatica TaxID=2689987 RepID=A0A3N0V133_9GAMM|nr:hypothetical protein [Stagnimonas aquatica]ROH86415.1 hypothetical protein ED208_15360 [Stagnimonas aquatica]